MVLQKMRAGAQGIAAKILVGLIVFVLAVFGFGAFDLFSVSDPVAATVNGDDITQRTLENEVARQRALYRAELGADVTDALLDSIVTSEAVLARLVNEALLLQAAEDLDLSVAEQTVLADIRRAFAEVGGFDQGLYRRRLAELGYTPASYQAERAGEMRRAQLNAGIGGTAFVTGREVRRVARVQGQRRDIAWLKFDVAALAATVVVSEEEIEHHYGDNVDDYMTEERFDFDLVRLPRERLAAEVEVDEEAILAAYEDEIALQKEPRRHAAHILLEVNDERSAEQAAAQLAALRDDVLAGADFGDLARENSQDPGSAAGGGDLGVSGRGVFTPAFEEALWLLEPGEVSQPVATEFGVHLIKLIAIEEAEVPTLDERRAAIAEDLREAEVQRRFGEAVREMDTIAFEEGDSLDALTAAFSLAVEPLDGTIRGGIDGVFQEQAVRDALFADEVLLEGFNSQAVSTDTEAIVGRLRTRHPATERPLEEVREQIRAALAGQRGESLAETAAYEALTALAAGQTPAEVSSSSGVAWERADGAALGDPEVPPAILRKAFELAAPGPGERVRELATLDDGSRALVVLSGVELGDYGTVAEADRASIAASLGRMDNERSIAALLGTLRADASIDALAFDELDTP